MLQMSYERILERLTNCAIGQTTHMADFNNNAILYVSLSFIHLPGSLGIPKSKVPLMQIRCRADGVKYSMFALCTFPEACILV